MRPWQRDLGAGFGMLVHGRASGTALLFTSNDCEKLGHTQHKCHVEHKHAPGIFSPRPPRRSKARLCRHVRACGWQEKGLWMVRPGGH